MELVFAVFLISMSIAALISLQAHRLGLVDVPNERSSHSSPTPRGGGVGIFIALSTGIWWWTRLVDVSLGWRNVFFGAAAVALVGLWDDVRSVSARWRFGVHLFAAALLVAAFSGHVELVLAPGISLGGFAAYILAGAGVVCSINMFNFMDGTDGLAASEAVFVTGGAALILFMGGQAHSPPTMVCMLACAAAGGFLPVNWPPARIFMGDVGSGFLGYAIAALALWTMVEGRLALWTWVILGGMFIVDATITLSRRLLRRENVLSAHRMHAYQRLARRCGHRAVAVLMLSINIVWLFPLAAFAAVKPSYAPFIAIGALSPICVAVWVFGAGSPDSQNPT